MRIAERRIVAQVGAMHRQFSAALFLVLFASSARPQLVELGSGSVVQTVRQLKAGEYVWAPQVAPKGPLLLIVNIARQRALLYRNGVPIGATTVSTGRPGYPTPTGVFSVIQKEIEHYSRTYDNAPMPYMQRLTWRGVALHAGKLPGYPASHGCIRLPAGFAKLLYGVTHHGMTVIISNDAAIPRLAPSPLSSSNSIAPTGLVFWQPDKEPQGPVSIIVSTEDKRVTVLRNGTPIGSAPVEVAGTVQGTAVYELEANGKALRWVRVGLSAGEADTPVPAEQWSGFRADPQFRSAVGAIVKQGTVVIVTSDSLRPDDVTSRTLIETEPGRP